MSNRNPDDEPWAYPPNYILALRNPKALTAFGVFFPLAGLAFTALVVSWVVDKVPSGPGAGPLSPAFILFAALLPAVGVFVLWVGVIRLRWQRSYFRRHGVMPSLIGSKKWKIENADKD